ncbi:FKBP-type peptidyl-prolyl cis-trans isomerase [Ornithinimicrobium humiphilum]|uniref:peptidylprolyl isomerase n=1 Tax=Ornithinimicrobium humiphilum TaxID=125288 RepID=A0A543KP78_9MICO|nr:FKBP-type peptidyl-prolyl cis-trans isomerase [Ornithinimicrobium humiphilum]TQM96870.1 peptidylprolyl isomerase [Ornithinimicrobium humiphilum]
MRSPRLRLAALAAAPLLLLSACATDGDADQADQTATSDDAAATSLAPTGDISELSVDTSGDEPVIERDGSAFADSDLPFVVASTETETVEEGDGDAVEEGHEVRVRYVAVNGATGEPFASTYQNDETVVIDLSNEMLFPAFLNELPGRSVGETFLLTIPAEEGFGSAGNDQLGVGPQDTLVFFMEIVDSSAPLTKATGEEVEPEAGLPEVDADGENAADITIPEGADEPTDLVAQQLIKGEGPEVQAGQTIKVHYTGVKWSDGEIFDDSYSAGQPAQFPIGVGSVIEGWDSGLVGQPVGSRVLLVIPADQAYGEAPEDTDSETAPPASPLAGETLVFVVDILGAY